MISCNGKVSLSLVHVCLSSSSLVLHISPGMHTYAYAYVCISAWMFALCVCMCVHTVWSGMCVWVWTYTPPEPTREVVDPFKIDNEGGDYHWASSATCTPDCEAALIGFTRTHTHTRCESVHTHTHGGRRCSFTIYGSLYCFLELTMNTVFAVQDWRLIACRLDSLHTQVSPLINPR